MSAINLYLVYFIVTLTFCEAYKILVVFPLPGRSHANLGDGVVRHLLKDGHEVTYISTFPYKSDSPKLRMIDVSANSIGIPGHLYTLPVIMNQQFADYNSLFDVVITVLKLTFQNDNVQKLLNDPNERFDVVIAEWLLTELPVGFAAVYNCPFIWISSLDTHWSILKLIDQPSNPAYTGHAMSTILPPFNFWQRVVELYNQLRVQFWRYTYFDKLEKQHYEDFIAPIIVKQGREVPFYYDIQHNASLVLANSHHSLGQAIPIPRNYIPVGGFHINEEVEPLPEDLQKIMDNATNGVIYFSMGSNLKSKDIPKAIKDGLIKMFSELKQTVLWKYEEDLYDLPKNVHILKWAPQHCILSHPNTVLFITHGGLLSTTESVHFGVPIIGIPIFADQFNNIAKAVRRGFARKVQLSVMMFDELKAAIEQLTTDSRYAEKAKELSFVYHDRTVPPGKEITHWVRHVIQTRGAPLLRSPALHVPFYQRLYLDLLAVIIVILYAIVKLLKYLNRFNYSRKMLNGNVFKLKKK